MEMFRESRSVKRRRLRCRQQSSASSRGVSLQLLDVCQQLRFRRQTHEVVAHHLVGPPRRLAAGPQADQHARDDRAVRLDRDAVLIVAQEMATAEHVLEEPEEQFSVPIIMPPKMTLVSGVFGERQ